MQSWLLPLGSARGAIVEPTLGSARGAIVVASLGAQLWQLSLGFARGAIITAYRKIMSVMREKPIWLLIFEMNSCFRRVNSCRQGAL
jgi:hypothetical protein